jgi:alginate O-acetyltransferase complex protein AlgI
MFGLMPVANTAPLLAAGIYTPYLLLVMVLCAGLVFQPLQAHDWAQCPVTWPRIALVTPLFFLALMTMYSQAFNPFLYFQF